MRKVRDNTSKLVLSNASSLISYPPYPIEGPSSKRAKSGPSGGATSDGGHPGGFQLVSKDGDPMRRKIRIEYIADKSRRHITFSKRKSGIMKKVRSSWL